MDRSIGRYDPIAVRDISLLSLFGTVRIARRRKDQVLACVLSRPFANAPDEVWVTPSYSGHRGMLDSTTKIAANHDSDHLYNRQRARAEGYGLIKLLGVPSAANRSHGAVYEKIMTTAQKGRPDEALASGLAIKFPSPFVEQKLAGLKLGQLQCELGTTFVYPQATFDRLAARGAPVPRTDNLHRKTMWLMGKHMDLMLLAS